MKLIFHKDILKLTDLQNKRTKISGLTTNMFVLEIRMKRGLEFYILKFQQPLHSCCCPVQKICPKRLNWPGRLAGISEGAKGPFVNYVSIQGYLVGQQNAYFTKQTLFSKYAYLGYLLGQKQAKTCLRNLRTAPYVTISFPPYSQHQMDSFYENMHICK